MLTLTRLARLKSQRTDFYKNNPKIIFAPCSRLAETRIHLLSFRNGLTPLSLFVPDLAQRARGPHDRLGTWALTICLYLILTISSFLEVHDPIIKNELIYIEGITPGIFIGIIIISLIIGLIASIMVLYILNKPRSQMSYTNPANEYELSWCE